MARPVTELNRFLVIGATGLLGQALMAELARRDREAIGLARAGAEIAADITDDAAIARAIRETAPDAVINTAALIDIEACQRQPEKAAHCNARAVGVITGACRAIDRPLIHVSTDHFFTGDGRELHDEDAPVTLVNAYARSKFAGEKLAAASPRTLTVRTNFTGWRGRDGAPTFFEWAVGAIRDHAAITAFADFYTSTIDAPCCARGIVDLAEMGRTGLINLAAAEVASKQAFLFLLADALGGDRARIEAGSVCRLATPRAESLGLDCRRAQALLDWELPDARVVIRTLLAAEPGTGS